MNFNLNFKDFFHFVKFHTITFLEIEHTAKCILTIRTTGFDQRKPYGEMNTFSIHLMVYLEVTVDLRYFVCESVPFLADKA